MALIFISHSSKDNDKTESISKFISDNGIKSVFLDYEKTGIKIGEAWEQRLYTELKRSHVVLVLLSPAWIASDWCKLEYSQARALGKEILPLIIEHGKEGEVAKWIGNNIQQKDYTKDDSVLATMIERVKEVAVETQQGFQWDVNRSPYPGMTSFEKEDAAVFFGKTFETIAVIEKLTAMKTRNSPKLLNMVAASGMGKSSLLRAGVLPKIELSYGNNWVVLPVFKPTQRPLYAFSILITTFLGKDKDSYKALFETLMSDNYKDALDDIVTDIGFLSGANKSVLFSVDQAEEFYTVARKEEKKHFFKVLTYLLEKKENFFTLWTLRSDFINLYQVDADTMPLHGYVEFFSLEPMAKENIAAIIKNPAKIAAIEVDDALVEKIKEDIETTDALPLLALCLDKLYQKHADSKKFTLSDYNDLTQDKTSNPLENIVKEIADSAIERWRDDKKKMEVLKKAFIPHLVRVGDKSDYVKRVALWEEMPKEAHEMLESLVKARLLIKKNMSTKGDGVVTVEVAHETLLRTWPLLKEWLKEEDEFLIGKSQLEVSYGQWSNPKLSKSEKKKALLSGLQLDKALEWKNKLVDEKEMEYIEESEKFRKRQQRKINIVVILTILMVAVTIYLQNKNIEEKILSEQIIKVERDKAREQVKKAKHNLGLVLVEKALNSEKQNKMVEAHYYAIKSLHLLNNGLRNKKGYYLAINILNKNKKEVNTLRGHNNKVFCLSYSPNGKTIASGSLDGTIKLWDLKSGELKSTLDEHTDGISSITISPDGKTIASGSSDGTIKLWDMKTKKIIAILKGHSGGITSLSYSPNGKIIVSASWDGTSRLWDMKTKKIIAILKGHSSGITSLSYSPDGKIIALGLSKNNIQLWNVKKRKIIFTLRGHSSGINSLSFSPNGKIIASASWDRTIILWDTKTQKKIAVLNQPNKSQNSVRGGVLSISFSPNGKIIAAASINGNIVLWDIESKRILDTLRGHSSGVNSLSFSPDGKIIASASSDKTIKLWDMGRKKELRGHKNIVTSVVFSPDGKMIASGSYDYTIKLWDTRTQRELITLRKNHSRYEDIISVGGVDSISFSPDGKMVASGLYDHTIMLWSIKKKTKVALIKGHSGEIYNISFSPDGKMIASGSADDTIKLWDVKTKKEIATLLGHASGVTSVSFSPDGKMIASSSRNGIIKLWDIKTKTEITTLKVDKYKIRHISFSPDGRRIAFSKGWTIQLWDIFSLKNTKLYGKYLEYQLQAKLDDMTLVPTKIPYIKAIWPKYHPFHWEDKAEAGDAEAMYQLGIIYDRDGENEKALEWYKKALKAGHKEAQERIDFLEKWMREHPDK